MIKIRKWIKTVQFYICLGLSTFLLVSTAIPTLATAMASESLVVQRTSASELLNQGRNLYQTGRYTQSAEVWQRASRSFFQQGDKLSQALSLSYLSLAQQALGEWEEASQSIEESLTILQELGNPAAILAQALNTQGQLYNSMGQIESALSSWEKAETAYQATEDNLGVMGSQINQAQALKTLGLHRRAQQILISVQESLQSQPESVLKVQGLRSLGVALQVVGDVNESQVVLEESLTVAQDLNLNTGEILLSLGNTARDLGDTEAALDYYRQAVTVTNNPQVKLEAQLNQLRLELEEENNTEAITLLNPISNNLTQLPPSRNHIYAIVNYAQSLSKLAGISNNGDTYLNQAAPLVAQGIKEAKNLGDLRAESFALIQLGSLYEQKQQYGEALKITRNALQLAQSINATDISYRGAWQLGRLLEQQGDRENAIAAYRSAFKILQSLRSDLVAMNTRVQFEFTENIEPLYREFVALLLEPSGQQKQTKGKVSPENLAEARQVIEALQLAELDNFFREACLKAQPKPIDDLDDHAAVIYPIILPDRLEIIVSLPGKKLLNYASYYSEEELTSTFRTMRRYLNPSFTDEERLSLYEQAYDWLIRPVEKELERQDIHTLVFVLDGYLRSLPMAALYDGEQYLIEKYSVALSQGLQLTAENKIESVQLEAITAGVSEARQGFNALPAVEAELNQISQSISSKLLLNKDFTADSLQASIDSTPSPLLHLATHGQFSSSAEETFILTWNGRIRVKEFDSILRLRDTENSKPIELLVLSACQTAQGDNRAMLGLSGLAIRSGARSTLGTLWSVRDESTAVLMADFYEQLKKPGISKADALRNAQLHLLKGDFPHPIFWAPFILVGNWL